MVIKVGDDPTRENRDDHCCAEKEDVSWTNIVTQISDGVRVLQLHANHASAALLRCADRIDRILTSDLWNCSIAILVYAVNVQTKEQHDRTEDFSLRACD